MNRAPAPFLTARSLALQYGPVYALREVSLQLPARGLVAIVGHSGCGKSSLLHVLSGLRTPTAGSVALGGVPLRNLPRERLLRNAFSFVFQQHFLIDYLSALENVCVPLRRVDGAGLDRAVSLLASLGLLGVRDLPARKLSGGERGRVAIARALVRPSQVLFADEPTAALDRASANRAYALLSAASKVGTVLLVTHDETGIALADRVITLRDGVLIGDEVRDPQSGSLTPFSS